MRCSILTTCLAACLYLGTIGCGKIPTWGELTGGQPAAPATPAQPVAVQQVMPVQQMAPPAPPSAAEIVARFQAIRSADISDTDITRLTDLNDGLELITEIDATGAQVTSNAFQSIEKLTSLQQLRLTGCARVDDQACIKIGLLPSLEVLALSNTNVSDVGVAALSSLPNLKQLELSRCRLNENGFAAIGQLPALKTVMLDSTNMDNRKLDLLCNAKTITSLTLPRNPINDFGLVALKKLDDLEFLELAETGCSGAGLFNATKGGGLKHLKFLGMYANPVNAQGAKAISTIKSLEKISLGAISIMSDADFFSIVQGMKNLKHVYIARCENMNGSGLAALKGAKDLEELFINNCPNIGDGTVKIIKGFKNLKIVAVTGTAITPNGIAELKNALPDCKFQ